VSETDYKVFDIKCGYNLIKNDKKYHFVVCIKSIKEIVQVTYLDVYRNKTRHDFDEAFNSIKAMILNDFEKRKQEIIQKYLNEG
jgi:hypothetical protein